MTMDTTVKVPELPELTFEDVGHIYRLDGEIIPSVTTIMAPLSDSHYAGIAKDTLARAAEKGTAVHNAIENFTKFGIKDLPGEYAGYFDAFIQWWEMNKPVMVASEIRLYHKLMRYGGTLDHLSFIDGELTLVDYKTTANISDMTCGVQLEAYSQALACLGIHVQRKKILHLRKNGKFDVREYPVKDIVRWKVFGSLKNVYDYLESYR